MKRAKKSAQTPRERILAYIEEYHREHEYAPSNRDIAEELDCSLATVQWHLNVLEDAGIISRAERIPRSIVIR